MADGSGPLSEIVCRAQRSFPPGSLYARNTRVQLLLSRSGAGVNCVRPLWFREVRYCDVNRAYPSRQAIVVSVDRLIRRSRLLARRRHRAPAPPPAKPSQAFSSPFGEPPPLPPRQIRSPRNPITRDSNSSHHYFQQFTEIH